MHELLTIASYDRKNPATTFPNMPTDESRWLFWSSTSSLIDGNDYNAWYVYFGEGRESISTNPDFTAEARCVRGALVRREDAERYHVVDNSGDETVLDRATGLTWQKQFGNESSWQGALRYCEALEYAGFSDWRLPNSNELQSLLDFDSLPPCSKFPDMPPETSAWSSSSVADQSRFGWHVEFRYCGLELGPKESDIEFWCVREGS
jgi:hypothetical protein